MEVAAGAMKGTTPGTDTQDHPATRICSKCSRTKPIGQFSTRSNRHKKGERLISSVCQVCYLAHRTELRASRTPEQQAKLQAYRREYETRNREQRTAVHEAKLARRRAIRQLRREQGRSEPVLNARYTVKPDSERRARDIQYAAHEAKALKERTVKRQTKDPERYMETEIGEYLLISAKCRVCRKGIVMPGRCYTCATGQPRTIFRKAELRDEAIA